MRIASLTAGLVLFASALRADPLTCNLTGYKAVAGLTAAVSDNTLTVTWDGDKNAEVRLRFTLNDGAPTIRDLAVRSRSAQQWVTLATNVTPEYQVVSGVRRATDQQLKPLQDLGVPITPDVLDRIRWEAFWDSPLNVPGDSVAHGGATPPVAGIANQPGLPRKPEEITRAAARYSARSCDVKTNGARLEVSFPGVKLGVFDGRLEYTVYKGSSLIRQAVVAKTEEPAVAYKYDAGLKGLAIQPKSQMVWRSNTSNLWVDYQFGGARNDALVPLKTANRVVAADMPGGSIAAFPPPHNFFWARETEFNLGYNWYRKDSDTSFSFGIRHAENEETQNIKGNFALYSGRPGTWQHMPVFYYVSVEPAEQTRDGVLAFTHRDHYKPLAGYQVMSHHYHMNLGLRLMQAGSADAEIVDLQAVRALGINIVSPVDNVGMGGGARNRAAADVLKQRQFEIDGARRHSDKDFLVMPDQEFYGSVLGGHTDLLFSHPVYWLYGRPAGQALVDAIPPYGSVYHIGSPDDLMEMVKREDVLMSMPHPRTKNNAGYPDGFKDKAFFKDPHFQGIGFRWGMGVDRSERRLCEYRCLSLLDDLSNWYADLPTPPKYLLAISEVQTQAPGDDIYSSAPISYIKLDKVPTPDDASAVIRTLMRGDYFVSSGEVLIPSYAVRGSGGTRTIVADVEWTFPLDFVEVVWGDGQHTDRQIISTSDLPAFGQHHFQIPFDATGKKWVRFAAWDAAGYGALVQPIKLGSPAATTVAR